jgi:hypothetical protein
LSKHGVRVLKAQDQGDADAHFDDLNNA